MELFEIRNKRAYPSVHALMIEPFKTMWETDKSTGKENCIKLFSYIELVCSPRKSNPFADLSEEDRPMRVSKEIYGTIKYPMDTMVVNAILKYKELLSEASVSYAIYMDGLRAAEKLRDYLRSFSLEERTPHGAMVIKPRDITNALKDIPDVVKRLEDGKLRVNAELLEAGKTRKDREIGMYED